MKKTIIFVFKLLFAPASLIKNRRVRMFFRITLAASAVHRLVESYQREKRRTERQARLAEFRRDILDHSTQVHLTMVDHAISNGKVVEVEVDDLFLATL